MPVSAQLRAATAALAAAGRGSPRVDAELLLAHVLDRRRGQLLSSPALSPAQQSDYAELVRQRCAGVPVQHLIGTAAFRHLELAVGPGVFIPRPETELLLDLAADRLAAAGTVLDLGAGSGAVALAVAQEYPAVRVIAVERSEAALTWLRANAGSRAAAGDRPVEVVAGDLADPDLLPELTATVDVLLSNPPYVPERIRDTLTVEIGHDPACWSSSTTRASPRRSRGCSRAPAGRTRPATGIWPAGHASPARYVADRRGCVAHRRGAARSAA
jgi:release factor glutamine methyltransferase